MKSDTRALAHAAMATVLSFRRTADGKPGSITPQLIQPFMPKAIEMVDQEKPLEFMLLGFPFKSLNREKVFGDLPDKAEELSLSWLNSIMKEVEYVYEPGVKLILGSDGLALHDLVFESEKTVHEYTGVIHRLIDDLELKYLKFWGLENQFPRIHDDIALQHKIPIPEGRDVESLHRQVLKDPGLMYQVNGISRFLKEDFIVQFDGKMSKTQIEHLARKSAYEVISRGDGLRVLYQKKFPDAIRLSVHPQPEGADKIGIKMIDNSTDNWMTPWHGIAVETSPNRFSLAKLHAVKDRITKVVEYDNGRPSYAVLY